MPSKTIKEISDYYLDWSGSAPNLSKLKELVDFIAASQDHPLAAIEKIKKDVGEPDTDAAKILKEIFKKDLDDRATKLSAYNILGYICTVAGVPPAGQGKAATAIKPPNPWQ